MAETEEWRVIKTFPLYMINRKGHIRGWHGQVIKPSPVGDTFVWLKSRSGGVHRRLVSTLLKNTWKGF